MGLCRHQQDHCHGDGRGDDKPMMPLRPLVILNCVRKNKWEKVISPGGQILFWITHNFKAVIANKIWSFFNHCSTLAENLVPHPFLVWAWQLRISHAVETQPFNASLWSSTISGKKIPTLSNVGFLQYKGWDVHNPKTIAGTFEWLISLKIVKI